MIVAYDLRYACDHFAGIGKHAYALLEELVELPGDERYLVLWNPDMRQTRFDLTSIRRHPRVEWHERPFHPIQPRGALQVGAWLRRHRPDVYLSPFSLRPIASGCRDVLTLHDISAMRMSHIPSLVSLALYHLSLRHAIRSHALITDSEFSRREILELLPVRAERVRAILLGTTRVDRPSGPPRPPERLRHERYALVVSDNRPRKNLEVLTRAWARLGADEDLALVGVGPVDPRFPSLGELATRAGAPRVGHLGWVAPEELAWAYEHAELVLLPSTYEGFGFPLLEAMAAGIPALVSDIPVFREVGGTAPEFADPADPEAWAAAVARLSRDSLEREQRRARGRARAAELTYRRTAEQTLAFLREIIRSR